MTSAYHPLLNPTNRTITNCKTFYFVIAICVVTALVIFSTNRLNPHLIGYSSSSHSDLSSLSPNICHQSHDPQECLAFVSEVVCDGVAQQNGPILLKKFLKKYVHRMNHAILETQKIMNQINDQNEQGALEDCLDLLDLSVDRVTDSMMALGGGTTRISYLNVQTWLSGALTNHVTCFDGLNISGRKLMGEVVQDLISRARASLAMLAAVHTAPNEEEMMQPLKGEAPSWLTLRDRKLLEKSAEDIKADAVVARDGTGDYKTIAEAVAAAPDKSKKRYVIYVKKGTYVENVEVTKKKKNLMIVGDGMDLTVVSGSLNVVDGSTTFKSATLAAVGDGLILQDICIQNTAGPEKHQAVALRVGADQSVINRCRIDAYQDTLYSHSLRQFYRDCYVTGTIDFIFGNAAVVLQNCTLVPRLPMKDQKNMVTAQGRIDPNQNTGTSIQNCEIIASQDLEPVKSSFPTYLGRPWKEYARVAVLESYIGDEIDPAGWSVWSGDFALKTLYFGEYMNRGPGAGTSKRVNWTGFHVITDPSEAMKFTVAGLIQGGEWLPSTGVAYTEGL